MTTRTRYFLFGSAGILVAGLCTGLLAYYGGFPTVASTAYGPAELSYVPADADVVAYANVREVMTSELRARLKQVMPEHGQGQNEFEQKTGLNIESDVDHVVACVAPSASDRNGGMVLVRGRFDQVRLETLARQEGGVVEEYRGRRLIRTTHGSHGDTSAMLGFMEPGLAVFGDSATVKRAIDTHVGGGKNVTSNDALMTLMREMASGSNAWAIGRFDAIAKRANLPDNVSRQIPPLHWFAASGHVNGGISGMLRAEARDEQAAENLRDVLRGFVALIKLQSSAKPELQAMLQSIELGGTGKTVAISFSIPSAVIDALPRPKHPAG
ncbi:MAG: hypothetical protein HYX76_08325 [Acidobacteria bacterium]|nr:hypothetical protein [Acidobacteriota bacterium]